MIDFKRLFGERCDFVPVMAIMIGIQASGKSTFCKSYLIGYDRINLDTLHTRNKENTAINEAFRVKHDMVIDNTNPTAQDREMYIRKAKENGYRVVGYFMQSKLQECVARNDQREGKAKVPAKAIAATSNRLQIPSYQEGFDVLYFVKLTEAGAFVEKWKEESLNEF